MNFYTSDLHFKHKRIVELSNRCVNTTAQEHDEWLIRLWNNQVDKNDTVYHLGDFCFSSKTYDIQHILNRLNGNKIFIRGNHCDRKAYATIQGIASIHDYLEVKINGTKTVLTHYPIAAWNQQGRGSLHLHGHCHGNLALNLGKALDVGLDSAYNILGEHRFFTEQDIITIMETKQIVTYDHHKVY